MNDLSTGDQRFENTSRVCKIIAAGLLNGLLVFLVIAWFLGPEPQESIVLGTVGLAAAVVIAVVRGLVLSLLDSRVPDARGNSIAGTEEQAVQFARERGISESRMPEVRDEIARRFDHDGTALQLFQTRLIVGLALLEGGGFINGVAYLVEGHWWSMATAVAFVLWMVLVFPTTTKLRRWVEDREQLRNFGQGPTHTVD